MIKGSRKIKETFDKTFKLFDKDTYKANTEKKETYKNKINNQPKLNVIKEHQNYHFDKLNEKQDILYELYLERHIMLKSMDNIKNVLRNVKFTSEFYARGLKMYIEQLNLLKLKISNAYLKLWEILIDIPELIPDFMTELNTFQMAELPGQFINSITRFIKLNRRNIDKYNWRANSLKPENMKNLMKYGLDDVNIFGDVYNLVKNNPTKWLWGADNTGDILNTINIKWYRDYFKDKKVDLVTGDGGMAGEAIITQKLDVGQMVLTLATSKKGSNCVIKHFGSYINSKREETKNSSGYLYCMLYSYAQYFEYIYITKPVTSNPNSGEFYLVGINFRGISDNELNDYLYMLDNFKLNSCWFNKDDLPKDFIDNVTKALLDIYNININNAVLRNVLYMCYYKNLPDNKKQLLDCNNQTNTNYHTDLRKPIFDEWIREHKFI
jgi:translation initiation factor 2 beta subunit (eIF-2beta)/eIF-5